MCELLQHKFYPKCRYVNICLWTQKNSSIIVVGTLPTSEQNAIIKAFKMYTSVRLEIQPVKSFTHTYPRMSAEEFIKYAYNKMYCGFHIITKVRDGFFYQDLNYNLL